ncbi:MAG: TetR/AcrR family transcriptional regulator [Acetobacteraceae bacterium]
MATRPRSYVVSLENRKPRGSGHERRGEILEAARELFLEHGVESVSTRQVAARVGISQTALYVYFKKKEDMLDSLVEEAFTKLSVAIQAIPANRNDYGGYLREMMRAYIWFGLHHPDEYKLALLLKNPRPKEARPDGDRSDIGEQAFAVLETIVAEAAKTGVLRSSDPSGKAVAQALWAAVHGLVALLITHPDFCWVATDDLIATQLDILMNGVLMPNRASLEPRTKQAKRRQAPE